ncbi:unnamed protein product [Symbiodinium natans]|uniref:Uncharacterized protein n=1 Tax=Symbiodinium natans TaxID=878477 RepID=A0A812QFP9_9DINO|nr:unnamed protein product [Symbiodinium natans]
MGSSGSSASKFAQSNDGRPSYWHQSGPFDKCQVQSSWGWHVGLHHGVDHIHSGSKSALRTEKNSKGNVKWFDGGNGKPRPGATYHEVTHYNGNGPTIRQLKDDSGKNHQGKYHMFNHCHNYADSQLHGWGGKTTKL